MVAKTPSQSVSTPPSAPSPGAPGRGRSALSASALFKRRRATSSGIVSTFLGGSQGEPGTVGQLGLTGAGF